MVDGIGAAKLDTAVKVGREVSPGLEGDMAGAIKDKAGALVELLQTPISNNGGRIVQTLPEGETDTIATT